MPKVSALQLLDRALLPTVVIIGVKLLGIFFGSLFFKVVWTFSLSRSETSFLFLNFQTFDDLSLLINFSDTLLVLACGLSFSWGMFQANHLNIDKAHPKFISKIYRKEKIFWVTTTGQIYHQISVWLGLSWLVLFLVMTNVYQGLTSSFVLGLALAVTLGLTFVFYDFVRRD